MRFAYADPPYPGQAKRWYDDHPDYGGEVDHAELITRLTRDYPDGWVLSTSANALYGVLPLCPPQVQVAVWHVTNRTLRGNGRWWLAWEPVLVCGGRQEFGFAPIVRNVLACGSPQGVKGNVITGQKPPAFTHWVCALLGAQPGDTMDDLFPGSGAVSQHWDYYLKQPWLSPTRRAGVEEHPARRARQLERLGLLDPLPEEAS